jgi:antagonist of KipI
MSGITVLRSGLLTTIQDGGRWGFQHFGVPVGGPMDPFSMRFANLVVGNDADEASFEVTLAGPELRFNEDAQIVISGAELSPAIVAGELVSPVLRMRPTSIAAGSVLRFGERKALARAYIAIRGGIDASVVLGSRSTSLQAAFPGLAGRRLRVGDVLGIGTRSVRPVNTRVRPPEDSIPPQGPVQLHFLWGPDRTRFSDRDVHAFVGAEYRVSSESNRMGYRLDGPSIELRSADPVLSEATPLGTIQVPPSGQPILLMADRQTTGGYARIGTVITADIGLAGQLAPGDAVGFIPCEVGEAVRALKHQHWVLSHFGPSQ